jgi:hypothetical protein
LPKERKRVRVENGNPVIADIGYHQVPAVGREFQIMRVAQPDGTFFFEYSFERLC